MKIFIIGKNGQLGSELVKCSNDAGNETFSFGRQDLDITSYDKVKEKIEQLAPDVVINTAAYHIVSDCEKYPDIAFSVNAAAQKNIALICKNNDIKLVYLSTDKVFDGEFKKPYKENDIANPVQVYGISKLAGEIATLNYNPNSLIIRTCGIFGGLYGSRAKKGNFVLYILNQSKIKREIEISSEQIANFAYADDLALGILQLLEKKSKGIFNLVNQGYSSWAKFSQEIVKIRKLEFKIIPIDRKGVYGDVPTPIFTALNTDKAGKKGVFMGGWRDALKRYLDFLEKNGI